MNPLDKIFETSKSTMNTRSLKNEKMSSYVPGQSEAASTNLAKLWRNTIDLNSAKSVTETPKINLTDIFYHLDYLSSSLTSHLNRSL